VNDDSVLSGVLPQYVMTYDTYLVYFFLMEAKQADICNPMWGLFEYPDGPDDKFASCSTASLSLRWHCSYLVLDKIQDNLHLWPVRFRKLAVRVAGSKSLEK